jgi:hypothetical protein
MPTYYHITSSLNRASIEQHGLDPTRMGNVPGIAGAGVPEVDGVFLAFDLWEVRAYANFRVHQEMLDIWRINDLDAELRETPNGTFYVEGPIPREMIELIAEVDPQSPDWPAQEDYVPDRAELLRALIVAPDCSNELVRQLSTFAWDSEPIVTLTREDCLSVLGRFGRGALTQEQVYTWADAVEVRDDIDYEPAFCELIGQFITEAANPDLFGQLDLTQTIRWFERFAEAASD